MDFGFIMKVIMKDAMTCEKQSSVTEKTFCLFSNAVFMETQTQKGESTSGLTLLESRNTE